MTSNIVYVALICLAIGAGVGWKINGYKLASEAAEVHEATQKAIIDTLMAYDAEKTTKEEVKRENLKIVDARRRDLADFRLRLQAAYSSCADTQGGESGASAPRPLPDRNQEAADRFTKGLAELALSADRIVEDCRAR